jgi:hypothetical protein
MPPTVFCAFCNTPPATTDRTARYSGSWWLFGSVGVAVKAFADGFEAEAEKLVDALSTAPKFRPVPLTVYARSGSDFPTLASVVTLRRACSRACVRLPPTPFEQVDTMMDGDVDVLAHALIKNFPTGRQACRLRFGSNPQSPAKFQWTLARSDTGAPLAGR